MMSGEAGELMMRDVEGEACGLSYHAEEAP